MRDEVHELEVDGTGDYRPVEGIERDGLGEDERGKRHWNSPEPRDLLFRRGTVRRGERYGHDANRTDEDEENEDEDRLEAKEGVNRRHQDQRDGHEESGIKVIAAHQDAQSKQYGDARKGGQQDHFCTHAMNVFGLALKSYRFFPRCSSPGVARSNKYYCKKY